MEQLRRMIPSWPMTLRPKGRLITAVDVTELPPPYRVETASQRGVYGILLLFSDALIMLKKLSKSSITARGLMAQVDAHDVSDSKTDELTFRQALDLSSFDITELDAGRMMQLMPNTPTQGRPGSRPGSVSTNNQAQVFHLTGGYEGKASRFVEDLTKARVEGRYPEVERDSHKFEVRSGAGVDLIFFSGLSESTNSPEGRGAPSKARIWICPIEPVNPTTRTDGVDVYASLTATGNCETPYRVDMYGPNEYYHQDDLSAIEFLPVLTKRCKLH